MTKIPTSFFSRGSKLVGLASKLAVKELSSRVKTWESDAEKLKAKLLLAQDVVRTLSQLKGASMKLGQLLSLDLGEYLPPEVIRVLEELHHQSTFLPFEQIEATLKAELKDKFTDFESIEEIPIAAASIGQVHRAVLAGKTVVIKVQYPGVAESIPSDLKLLRVIVRQLTFFQGKDIDFAPFFDEVEEVLFKEADYCHEIQMHQIYRKKFEGSPYVIPEVYPEHSTGKVLTSEFIAGVSFVKWLETRPSQDTRNRLAQLFMRLYLEELFHHGIVQTDPNPGNFLITQDDRIALLDFGAAKVYSRDFVDGYRKVLLAAHRKERRSLLEESLKLKFIDARESPEVQELYLNMMEFLSEPFREDADFDFADRSFLDRSRVLAWELTRKCKHSPPPKDLLFLHRKLAGMFFFIKKLEVKINLKDYWHLVEEL
ncbi:MAG TPA: AarF/ABC1/UbiB kinase family protein [Bacteriovoracaceae bacterium]|nr:AarF/ABC1/UbiB kinase family protein [Bacteriovoracaceae bacterium]